MPRPRQGSITWNKKRKCWTARLDWTDDDGEKHCRKRQVESKTAGNILVKKWIRDLEEQGAAYLDAEKMTFKDLAEKYQEVKLVEPQYRDGKKVSGLRAWKLERYRIKHLIEHFGNRRVRSITYADIEKYRSKRLATQTIFTKKERGITDVQRYLSTMRACFTFAVQNEWLIRSPFSKGDGLISMAMEPKRERVYSTDEQRAILQACQMKQRRHVYPIVLTALDSGCRKGELLGLKWCDVDLEKGALTVIATNAKTNRKRVIDLEPITIEELRRMAKESGGFADDLVFGIKSSFDYAWRKAREDAKVEDAHFHDLRATAITTWLLRGMSVPFAMNRSGHADPRIFMRYVRMCEEIQAKQREQLREWDLAASLAELATTGSGASATGDRRSSDDDEPTRIELIN
jgi:integrase